MLLPFLVIAGMAVAFLVIALVSGVTDPKRLQFIVQLGAMLGAFACLFGVFDLLAGIFIFSNDEPFMKRFYIAVGYLLTWSIAVAIIWYSYEH